jgi:hypothetical protein
VSTDITILDETVSFAREADLGGAGGASGALGGGAGSGSLSGGVYGGRFTWRVRNFDAFAALLRTQKIMSPGFPAGEVLRLLLQRGAAGGSGRGSGWGGTAEGGRVGLLHGVCAGGAGGGRVQVAGGRMQHVPGCMSASGLTPHRTTSPQLAPDSL